MVIAAPNSPPSDRTRELVGRRAECRVLDKLLDALRAGQSQSLVLRGEPGMGKSALLEALTRRAGHVRVIRVSGVQSEMELAFAGLYQVCAPLLDELGELPLPQAEALRTAFGIKEGPAPDRFLIGLAVLGLLSDGARERPVLCLVDDVQWLDLASAQVLGFVARRLGAESVGVVFSTRLVSRDLAHLAELEVKGLAQPDARALLDAVLQGPIDARVRDQIAAETRGNPLALLELPRLLSSAELAGGFGVPGALPVVSRMEDSFRRKINGLPTATRRLLQLAAADPTGDSSLLWRAAERLGISAEAAGPAIDLELAEFNDRVRFRHPLVRSAAYRTAGKAESQEVHRALADATEPTDPDRRAWHRARAAAGPDENVAAALEQSAGRAQALGGLPAVAAFMERAALLTPDAPRRAGRALEAADAHLRAGAFGKALELLARAEAGPLDELQSARADRLRGLVALASAGGSDAPSLLLKAARRLQQLAAGLACETFLDAWQAALFAGHLTISGHLEEISLAALARSPEQPPQFAELLLEGLSRLVAEGPAVAAPFLREAADAFAGPDVSVAERLRWAWAANVVGAALWDDRGTCLKWWPAQLARDTGALDQLPMLLNIMAVAAVWRGDLAAAASLVTERDAICEATGARTAPYAAMRLASIRGREAEAAPLIREALEQGAGRGQGAAVTWANWVAAVLYNGMGRYAEALAAAQQASGHGHAHISMWALPELVEAAARTGNNKLSSQGLDRLSEWTQAGGSDWGLGVEARCRALLADGESADQLYKEAISRLGRTSMRPELARAHLLYGEWLRRQRRRSDARKHLRVAWRMLDEIGMEAFAERARRELRATGESVRRRPLTFQADLTPQESQIARLAADGLSNPEIAARLFLSPRTVQYHLGKVFAKLAITSRSQLTLALSGS